MTVQTRDADAPPARHPGPNDPAVAAAAPRRATSRWVLVGALVLLAAAAAVVALNAPARGKARELFHTAWGAVSGGGHGEPAEPHVSPAPHPEWKGVVEVDASQAKTVGIQTVVARAQTAPLRIDVNGKTD